MIHSADLQCDWDNWSALGPTTLELHCPAGNYCNMNGAIKVAQAIMPDVQRVVTTVGGTRDVEYVRSGSEWACRDPSPR